MREGNSEVTSQKLNEIIQHSLDQATAILVKASENFNIEDKVAMCFLINLTI